MKKLVKESLNINKSTVDLKKLKEYANAIGVVCDGEYGNVYFNELENHIFVNLGDSNPFDLESLERIIKEAIVNDWRDYDKVIITIENEVMAPKTEGWKKIN